MFKIHIWNLVIPCSFFSQSHGTVRKNCMRCLEFEEATYSHKSPPKHFLLQIWICAGKQRIAEPRLSFWGFLFLRHKFTNTWNIILQKCCTIFRCSCVYTNSDAVLPFFDCIREANILDNMWLSQSTNHIAPSCLMAIGKVGMTRIII